MMQRLWQRGSDGEVVRTPPTSFGPSADADRDPAEAGRLDAVRKRASFWLALRLGLRDTYDYLGAVLLISILYSVAVTLAAMGGQAVAAALFQALPAQLRFLLTVFCMVLGAVLAGGPLAAGIFRFARNAANRQEPELFDLRWGFRRELRRSLMLGAIQAFGGLVLAGNAFFYITLRQPVAIVLGALFLYGLAFWGLMLLYQWALLAEGEPRLRGILRKSALLALDNFGYSLFFGAVRLVFTVVSWGTMIVGALLWAGASAMITTQATRELLRRYDILPPDPTLDPIAGETHEFGGHGWHE